jgi:CDGSH-type Zn-finger protein
MAELLVTRPSITVSPDGPYLVVGAVPLAEQHIVTNGAEESVEWREGKTFAHEAKFALCRCGHSKNKPFCDSTHKKVRFNGTETANREPYADQATLLEGPAMQLADAESLCAFARFCDREGSVWGLVEQTDNPEAKQLFEHEATHCPSGRLVAIDRKTDTDVEPSHEPPSIGLIVDTAKRILGPIWVRGGIPVTSADGETYEIRNRVTLCRCGRSNNKPFCDGSHAAG